jgi:hypothetical protein
MREERKERKEDEKKERELLWLEGGKGGEGGEGEREREREKKKVGQLLWLEDGKGGRGRESESEDDGRTEGRRKRKGRRRKDNYYGLKMGREVWGKGGGVTLVLGILIVLGVGADCETMIGTKDDKKKEGRTDGRKGRREGKKGRK